MHMQSMKTVLLPWLAASWVLLAPPAEAAVLGPAPKEEASFSDLTTQAESHRAAGRYAESAQTFAAAYESLSEREQQGLKGEITIGNAVDDYRLAQQAKPESIGLLFQEIALLERYGKRMGGLPEELGKELGRAKARAEDLHRAEEERKVEAVEEQRKVEAVEEAKERDPVENEPQAERTGPAETEPEAGAVVLGGEDEPRPPGKADAAIVGVGVASLVGGVALITSGAWNLGNVRRRGDELLALVDGNGGGTPEMREAFRGDVDEWRKQWRGIGTGLMVGGAMLAAAGVGLTTWGVVRMRRGKRGGPQASVVRPMISGRGVGLVVTGRW